MRQFRVFIASPGDTTKERTIAKSVAEEINKTHGNAEKFYVELVTYEDDTYPSFGDDGQDVINRQIGDNYHIFVGIMWKKFGTPTLRAGSGTEEEFNRAYDRYSKKEKIPIMFYFNSAPIPQEADFLEAQKVKEFKKKIANLGALYNTYTDNLDFEKKLRMDLTKCILEIIKSEKRITPVPKSPDSTSNDRIVILPQINRNFKKYLNNLEARFAHSKVEDIQLHDIYIAPDLKDTNSTKKSPSTRIENLENLTNAIDQNGIKYAFLGNDLSGKSANCKYLFEKYFTLGLYPILLNGTDIGSNIRPEILRNIIEQKIPIQYEHQFSLSEIDPSLVVIIIDDFHKSTKGLNRYWPILMKNLESSFQHLIITGSPLISIENLNRKDAFKNYKFYTILEFGPKYRYDLVNKWNTIGTEARFQDQNDIRRKNDQYISHIRAIVGKNYIPSYPFYLLSILQSFESKNVQNPNYSIHGFYYELLINDCFNKAITDKKEISLYYNYLTQFCFHLFEQGIKEISQEGFDSFHTMYCKNHDLSYRKETILETFDTAKLLYVNSKIYIKEKYVYYFFVAKYIANEIANKQEIKELVSKMCYRLFRDEYASIILFVTHLSKDNFIISELTSIANSQFQEIEIARLQDDISEINELVKSLPEQILENVQVEDQRHEELTDEEELEKLEKELNDEESTYDTVSLEDDISTIDFFAKITRAFKTIDILGQVAKKHWGELNGNQKFDLVSTTYNLGLKTLNYYLQLLQKNSNVLVEHISTLIKEKHFKDKNSLEKNIEETSRDFVFRLCYMASFAITKRVSNSVGYDKLKNTFDKVLDAEPFNSVKLIDLSIKLGYSSIDTHISTIETYREEMDKNKLSIVLLQNLVIDYMYMFETEYRTKTKLCQKLGISMQDQLKIEKTSPIKKKQ